MLNKVKCNRQKKIIIISHMLNEGNVLTLPESKEIVRKYLELRNFTRVLTADNKLFDHMHYIKKIMNKQSCENFSVWDILLCSGLILSTHLKKKEFPVKLINYIDSENKEKAYKMISDFKPDIIILSTSFILSEKHLASIVKEIRKILSDVFIIAGGHHVYISLHNKSKDARSYYFHDVGVNVLINSNQGEDTLVKVCEAFPGSLENIPNLIYRDNNNNVIETELLPEDNDINLSLIDMDEIKKDAIIHIRTMRGCSFNCSFCSYPVTTDKIALMDIETVISILKKCKETGVKAIFYSDDTFNVPKGRFRKLLNRIIEEEINIPWYSFIRCQYIDEPLVKMMKKSGCNGVFLGIESGSDDILKEMNKKAVVDDYLKGITWLKNEKIITVGSFLIGFPGENADTINATSEFIENSGLDFYYIQPFYYLHHSPVHKQAKKYELTGEGLFWSHYSMNSKTAIKHMYRLFLDIKNSIWVNPDYTLWEIGYLLSKNIPVIKVQEYCKEINRMTARQMKEFNII